MYEGMDNVGREYLTGLVNWIEWIGEVKGRESVKKLGRTVGRKVGDEIVTVQYTRMLASMKNRMWEGGMETEGEQTGFRKGREDGAATEGFGAGGRDWEDDEGQRWG
jgi:hypothetical protein